MGDKRKVTLLKASYDFLRRIYEEEPWFGAKTLGKTVNYDDAECDGFCLMNDIAIELGLEEE